MLYIQTLCQFSTVDLCVRCGNSDVRFGLEVGDRPGQLTAKCESWVGNV
jgi:hypothetical protein